MNGGYIFDMEKLPVGIRKRKNSKNYFYRIKCILPDGRTVAEEVEGFTTADDAEKARLDRFHFLLHKKTCVNNKTFSDVFLEFISTECNYKLPLIKKYNSLYQAKLYIFSDFLIDLIPKNDVLWLIYNLNIDNRNNKKKKLTYTYINSVKSLLWRIFDFAYKKRYVSTHILYFLPRMWNSQQIKKSDFIEPIFAYSGNKYRLLYDLNFLFPINIENYHFIDVFGGSGVVALNADAKTITINEPNLFLTGILNGLHTTPPETAWNMVMNIVDKYQLNAENDAGYYLCRNDYNQIDYENRVKQYWYWGLALVYHSFNRSTVQHNKNYKFNAPFGFFKCDIQKSKERFMPCAEKLYATQLDFSTSDFREIFSTDFKLDTFLYVDPPYLTGVATYNKSWSENDEYDLYRSLDECSNKGVKWLLSNSIENNGIVNQILTNWLKNNKYRYKVFYLNRQYTTSNFRRKNHGKTIEIAVKNY